MTSLHRILVVDDDEGVRMSLGRVLRAKGYEVITASDGMSAIETAREMNPDITILDIRMPGLDGIETLEAMRKERPAARAMLMSAYASSHEQMASRIGDSTVVLDKPLNLSDFCERVRTTLLNAS